MATFHIVPPKEGAVVGRAVAVVAEVAGWEELSGPQNADWVVCFDAEAVERFLKEGKRVLHVGVGRSDSPLGWLSRAYPEQYEFASAIGNEAHANVTVRIFQLAGIASQKPSVISELSTALTAPPDTRLPLLIACPVSGKNVMVVDDKELNRKSALVQFGVSNEISEFSSYAQCLSALVKVGAIIPDILLADMLMPTEKMLLSPQALGAYLGSEIPAGLFVALAAARHGVPLVILQTDAGHHDHPALAAVDYIGWNEPLLVGDTKIVILRAHVTDGVKDWGVGLKRVLDGAR
jgi:hypothetical protein